MRAVSRVSRKGLVSIPASVRRRLGIEEGDLLVWELDPGRRAAVVRVVKNPLRGLKGRFNDPRMTYEEVEEEADALLEAELDASNRA